MDPAPIVTYGDEVLRRRAEDVLEVNEEIRALIERMYATMEESRGLGLAAPQIGVSKRVFVYDVGEGKHAVINPRIVKRSGEEYSVEGCLSIPGLQGEVPRALRVTLTGLDESGRKIRIRAEGLLARVFQHEIDHLEGTLFIDRADPDSLQYVTDTETSNGE